MVCPECGAQLEIQPDNVDLYIACVKNCTSMYWMLEDLPDVASALQYTIDQLNQSYLEVKTNGDNETQVLH